MHNIRHFVTAACACTLLACAPGCVSTVSPVEIRAAAPSYDGDSLNSGVLACIRDGAGNVTGWTVTARARDRYNALVAKCGSLWTPPIVPDYGVTPNADGTWHMTNEAMDKFIVMSLAGDTWNPEEDQNGELVKK
jgi:hypothetical protein